MWKFLKVQKYILELKTIFNQFLVKFTEKLPMIQDISCGFKSIKNLQEMLVYCGFCYIFKSTRKIYILEKIIEKFVENFWKKNIEMFT